MKRTIAIDFDGCLCKEAWPDIGAPNLDVISAAIREKQNGVALILWTCREGEELDAAIRFCKDYGLEFDAVNENLPERIALYGNDCRKIGADEYWDDRAVHMPALRAQHEVEDNEPLTLDELWEMAGEPVWCAEEQCWGIIKVDTIGLLANKPFLLGSWHDWGVALDFDYDIESCGLTLYRHKPKEEQNESVR